MPRHLLTTAEQLFWGNSQHPTRYDGNRGIPINPMTFVDLGAPAALDTTALISAATSTELPNAATITYTFPAASASPQDGARNDGILATPRNVTAVATHSTSIVAMTMLVTGKDVDGITMSELFTVTATGTSKTVAGKKTFKTITSIAVASASDATANTLSMGFGDVLGLPFLLSQKNAILCFMDGVPQATGTLVAGDTTDPATTTTGDVRGTYTPATATNGTRRYGGWMTAIPVTERYPSASSAYGITQA